MRLRIALPALLAVAAAGWVLLDPLPWLQARGLRVIREVSAAEGAQLLERPDTLLVQVRGGEGWSRVPGTEIVSPRDPLPPHWSGASATVVILADEPGEGLRVAARMARAGIEDVVVVRGGVDAWQAASRAEGESEEAGSGGEVAEST